VIHCKGDRGSKTRIYRMFSDALTVLLKDTTGLAHNGVDRLKCVEYNNLYKSCHEVYIKCPILVKL
jgi:hypothetical protein